MHVTADRHQGPGLWESMAPAPAPYTGGFLEAQLCTPPGSGLGQGALPLRGTQAAVFLWEVAEAALAPGRAGGCYNTLETVSPTVVLPGCCWEAKSVICHLWLGRAPLGPVGAESANLGRIPREFREQGSR